METLSTGIGGGKGGNSDSDHCLRSTCSNCLLLEIPRQTPVRFGQQIAGGGSQTQEGAEEVGAFVEGDGKGGGG